MDQINLLPTLAAAALKRAAAGMALVKRSRDRLFDLRPKAEATGIQLSDATREATQDALETRLFQLATGIEAEGRTRDELLDVKRSLPPSVSWFDLKQASPYIDTVRKDVSIPVLGWLAALGALLTGLLLALLSAHLFMLATTAETEGFGVDRRIGAILLSFLLFAGAGLFFRECRSVWTARKIGKHLALTRRSAEDGPVGVNEQLASSSDVPGLAKPAQPL